MNKILRMLIIGCLVITLLVPCLWTGNPTEASATSKQVVDDYAFTLNSLTATDALGRTLPRVSGSDTKKHVGLFYFLWHGQHPADKARNVTELLRPIITIYLTHLPIIKLFLMDPGFITKNLCLVITTAWTSG